MQLSNKAGQQISSRSLLKRGRYADVSFSCIIDPNTALSEQRLKEYGQGPHAHKWANCKLFKNHREMLQSQVRGEAVCLRMLKAHLVTLRCCRASLTRCS